MAYSPTTWTTGDTITAEKMNKLEKGVANEQVGPQGPKGETGPAGADGADGAAAGFGTPSETVRATYDPTNWKTGDVITATKLNNMETGIAGALQTSGGTMTGDITMSGNSQLIGNSTSSSMIDISQDVTNINLDEVNTPGQYFLSNSNNNDGAPNAERSYSATYIVISATSSNKNPDAVWKFYIVRSAPPKVYARYFVTDGSNTNSWYLISNTSTDPI